MPILLTNLEIELKLVNCLQGSPEWHQHRAAYFNASDAPAMMGCSPYKTRSQLLNEYHTGLTPDIDSATQHRFNEGHRFEALARPLAEEIIGDDLYPVVGSEAEYGASFDGLTMDMMTGFEHKTLGAELAKIQHFVGQELPLAHRVQMEQQCMVAGCDRILFMASKWDGDDLIEERHCWYAPDLELRAKIGQGWIQFEKDLAAYTTTAPTVQAVAAPVESLPAVSVRLDGQLVVASNLPEFGVALKAFIERIPAKPSTDQEFADCESACKALKKAEEALESAETHALAQMTDVEQMRRIVADLRNLARSTRLASEKMVTARKEQLRFEIVQTGHNALLEHVAALNSRLGGQYMPIIGADFALAIKGRRTIDSLHDAVNTTLANAKIEASATADKIQANLKTLNEHKDFAFLFFDVAQLVLKEPEFVSMAAKNRISDHQQKETARIEADRARIANEERIKAEAAAQHRADAEIAAARSLAEKQAQDAITAAQATPVLTQEQNNARPEPIAVRHPDTTIPGSSQSGEGAKGVCSPNVVGFRSAWTPGQAGISDQKIGNPTGRTQPTLTPPSLRLGQICERLGFNITAVFLKSLGFEPAATDKNSKLFHEADFPLICAALVDHIQAVQTKQAA